MNTLLLTRPDVSKLLGIEECITAIEQAFKLYAEGKALPPAVLGIHAREGGFHIKAGLMQLSHNYFVAKTNANFPDNLQKNNLPTIQGVIIVCNADNGRVLAIIDSIEITIIRTGAATAVAAKYLALAEAKIATICGCGNQGRISLEALMKVRKLDKIFAFDIDPAQSEKFARKVYAGLEVIAVGANELSVALRQSQICITCTPSKKPFIRSEDIMPGTFIAAVGADSEEKQELFPEVMAGNKIVVDVTSQGATIGELHHAIEQGLMSIKDIHAELGQIIAGQKPGRGSNKEVIIFDSTGTALQDVAAAAIVYERALLNGIGTKLNFSDQK